jgi:NAD(P)-dependent dehydrogenase (short-subunit alcohol dehydrogenase family)
VLPGHALLVKLTKGERLPYNAIAVTAVIAAVLQFISATKLYTVLINFTNAGFYTAFALPVLGAAYVRLRGQWQPGPWSLGRAGNLITYIAAIWLIAEIVNIAWPGGKVALVTGAASGIGAAVTSELRSAGWQVAGYDLCPSDADLSCIGDVTDSVTAEAEIRRVVSRLGPVRALVTAAGYYEMVPFDEIGADQWQRMLRVHLGGLVTMVRAVLPGMLERRDGRIVAVSSELAIGGGVVRVAVPAAAKGAIIGLVKSLAAEVAGTGVLVNSVAPGPTDTPLLEPDSPWRAADYLATLPVRRLASPQEIAGAVRFVIEEGSFMVGEVLSVNSGAVI